MTKATGISKYDANRLWDALHYMNMKELRGECESLHIKSGGKKADLIKTIFDFVIHGRNPVSKSIPEVSKAKAKSTYSVSENSLILKGAYKNDAKTRAFFKKLIGPHFHFTAFGIDWIEERWIKGKPPTYGDYAKMWQEEYQRRKTEEAKPKKEWAYLSFIQRMLKINPNATRIQVVREWKKVRLNQVKLAQSILDGLKNQPKNISKGQK